MTGSKGVRRGWVVDPARWLLDTLLPPLCPGCDIEIASTRWLCSACRRAFRRAPRQSICFPCREETRPGGVRDAGKECRYPGHRDRGRAAFWLESPLDRIVHAFKYGGRSDLGRPLGRMMLKALPRPGADLLLPIPLHPVRRRERGYNQAELLARELSVAWGIPIVPDLVNRTRSTHTQARVPEAERADNVSGAFEMPVPSWAEGRSIALVDDVATTGSTAGAVARALVEAGAVEVNILVLALA